MPAEKVIPYLKILFSQEKNATIRSKTFGALLALPKHDRVQYLLDIFEESSLDWQIAICEELGRLSPDSRSIVKLCSIASSAPDPDLRFAAVESLGNIGDHMAIPTLEHVSHHDKGKDYEGFSIAKEAHIAQEMCIRDRFLLISGLIPFFPSYKSLQSSDYTPIVSYVLRLILGISIIVAAVAMHFGWEAKQIIVIGFGICCVVLIIFGLYRLLNIILF